MDTHVKTETAVESRITSSFLEALIRAGLLLALVMICYKVFSPFLILMVWALILTVTLYPLHQMIARKMGGKQGLAATVLVIIGFILIVTPTAVLVNSMGDAVKGLIDDVQSNKLEIPPPRESVAKWRVGGRTGRTGDPTEGSG